MGRMEENQIMTVFTAYPAKVQLYFHLICFCCICWNMYKGLGRWSEFRLCQYRFYTYTVTIIQYNTIQYNTTILCPKLSQIRSSSLYYSTFFSLKWKDREKQLISLNQWSCLIYLPSTTTCICVYVRLCDVLPERDCQKATFAGAKKRGFRDMKSQQTFQLSH